MAHKPSNNGTDEAESAIDSPDESDHVSRLEEENAVLRERLDELENRLDDLTDGEEPAERTSPESAVSPSLSRRGALTGIGALGLLGVGAAGSASAAAGDEWSGSLANDHVLDLHNTATSGAGGGLFSQADSGDMRAIEGYNSASSGTAIGVFGRSAAFDGHGIWGYASHPSGITFGLRGEVESTQGTGLYGKAKAGSGDTIGTRGVSQSPDGIGLKAENYGGTGNSIGVYGQTNSPDGYGIFTPDDAMIEGDLHVNGTKNFVQTVGGEEGPVNVHYTAVEAGKAHTEETDVTTVSDGRAEIELPDHFDLVTSSDVELSVQITPYSEEKVHPQVVEKSTSHIVIEDFGDGPSTYTVSYTVKGVREGFEDVQVIHEDGR